MPRLASFHVEVMMPGSLGPHERALERFLNRLAELEFAQLSDVVVTWRDSLRRTDGWYAAEDAVGDAISRTRRYDEQWRLQGQIYELFRNSGWYTPFKPTDRVAGTEAAAQYLASSAAFALLVADALKPEHLGILYGPFAATIPLGELGFTAPLPRKPPSHPGTPDLEGGAAF